MSYIIPDYTMPHHTILCHNTPRQTTPHHATSITSHCTSHHTSITAHEHRIKLLRAEHKSNHLPSALVSISLTRESTCTTMDHIAHTNTHHIATSRSSHTLSCSPEAYPSWNVAIAASSSPVISTRHISGTLPQHTLATQLAISSFGVMTRHSRHLSHHT